MATRPETARKILVYWMDGMIAFLAIVYVFTLVTVTVLGKISLPHMAAALVCLLGLCGLFPLILRAAFDDKPRPTGQLVIAGLSTAGAVVLIPPNTPEGSWDTVGMLWLALLSLYLSVRATAAWGVVVVAVCTTYGVAVNGQMWQATLIAQVLGAVLMCISLRLWLWLWHTIRDAYDTKEAKARLAVSEERLRFARDLHDLLGHSLSVISLKSELAGKLAAKDPARASAEMADVRRLAAESLTEVDAAVQGYRVLDLDEELAGLCATLESAGASCTIQARADGLSPAARALLAWVVREGATNILKHSTATRCLVTLDHGVLEIRNDGIIPATGDEGSGLRGLSERMATAGGSLWAAPTESGEFLLRAAVPA